MDSVGYVSPFVPPEWIAAHGLRPAWLTLDGREADLPEGARRGTCPFAAALIVEALSGSAAGALVLATSCDQMRYAAAYLDAHCRVPTFLLNVPSTWQTPQSRRLYREELDRLGGFLAARGGRPPMPERLAATLLRYDEHRAAALRARPAMPAGQWSRTLIALRSDLATLPEVKASPAAGIPLALVGGPQPAGDARLLERVERAGGRIVLDASEGGERTLPAPFDRRRLAADPLDELVRAYFDTIPDAFRRPNTRLYEWLAHHLAARGVRGILFRRYLFCDLWNAELHRLRRQSGLPVLALDLAAGDDRETDRSLGRIEAFLETLTL